MLPLLGGDNHDGYDVVCKVRIEIFDHIPNIIDLARKTLKTNDKQEAHKQQSMVKFLAIHTKTMEAYMLWWNGRILRNMLHYNTKYSPIRIIIIYYNKGCQI